MVRMLRRLIALAFLAACSSTPQAEAPRTFRVFLLAGQSNMEGHGVVDLDDERDYNGGRGTLARFLEPAVQRAQWDELRNPDGSWFVRDDVAVSYLTANGTRKVGPLTVGFGVHEGAHHIGPELGIGRVLGRRFEEPVLLVKTAWGGKSLAVDFRPPSAEGDTGPFYTRMLEELRAALASAAVDHPRLSGLTPRLDGVIWFQGWNDGCDERMAAEYEENLVLLANDLRAEFGDPALPFVAGETGNMDNTVLREGQRKGCERLEFARFVPTREFLRPAQESPNTTHGHHWFGNGESYLRIGDALGRAMAELTRSR